ncbi:MAG TPA: ABC transporter ATP-binding protein [Anaerolineales bacterium]|nr:ABC transporter ATP-binding protein [Anaerolineales bacterium]
MLLDVHDLKVEFHTLEGTVHALNGVSFSVNPGQTLGIVGESGCGKSVSVLSVMRLIPQPPGRIVSGEVDFAGRDLLRLSIPEMQQVRGKDISMIFQDPMTSLNPVLTIGRQIGETMMVHKGLSEKEARQVSIDLLDKVGIPNPAMRLEDYPHHFSGGMRQRVMIAMALSCNPRLLIADEPTTALDVTIQVQILDLVKDLRDQLDMAVIWISHDLAVIAELADRVAVMYSGYLMEETDVFQLYHQPLHPYTLALLQSLPRMDTGELDKLSAIPGSPPDATRLPPGCPFAPRCRYAIERCQHENPPLLEVTPDHRAACWVDVLDGRPR